MAKICRFVLIAFCVLLLSSCNSCNANNSRSICGKMNFEDSDITKFNYGFTYILYNENKVVIDKKKLHINLLSKFQIPATTDSRYFEIFISKTESTYSIKNGGVFTKIAESGLHKIEPKKYLFHVTSSIVMDQNQEDLKFDKWTNLLLKWQSKKYVDFYQLEIFKDAIKDPLIHVLIPRGTTQISYEDLIKLTDVNLQSFSSGQYAFRVSGWKKRVEDGSFYLTIYPMEDEKKFEIY